MQSKMQFTFLLGIVLLTLAIFTMTTSPSIEVTVEPVALNRTKSNQTGMLLGEGTPWVTVVPETYNQSKPNQTGAPLDEVLEQGFPCHPDPQFLGSSWYDKYATRVYSVRGPSNCTDCNRQFSKMDAACARWWHPSPRHFPPYKPRKWSGVLRPKDQIVAPCEFGRLAKNKTACSASLQQLFDALDKLRVVYFPRSGTELGIVRESSYLNSDGDVDIFVDMPQKMLLKQLRNVLKPAPQLSGKGYTAEVHWSSPRCPHAHMVYHDWISLELGRMFRPEDLCSCRLNSVDLLCRKDGLHRMYTQYGPSWRVPLGVKCLDTPHFALTHPSHPWTKSLAARLKKLMNGTTGHIEKEAVNALMEKPIPEKEIPLVLAQLNVLANGLNFLKQS